jgi:hypothetical protein
MIIPLDRTKTLPSHYRAKAMTQLGASISDLMAAIRQDRMHFALEKK